MNLWTKTSKTSKRMWTLSSTSNPFPILKKEDFDAAIDPKFDYANHTTPAVSAMGGVFLLSHRVRTLIIRLIIERCSRLIKERNAELEEAAMLSSVQISV